MFNQQEIIDPFGKIQFILFGLCKCNILTIVCRPNGNVIESKSTPTYLDPILDQCRSGDIIISGNLSKTSDKPRFFYGHVRKFNIKTKLATFLFDSM